MSEYRYHANTQSLVFAIADMCKKVAAERSRDMKDLRPVLMIDGPAGTGKSTFTKDLLQRLDEIGVQTCFFEQDLFGLSRATRKNYKINACTDLARDPETVTKLKELMHGHDTKVPKYHRSKGVREKNAVTLKTADLIIYEGVSSLSSVIYENSEFSAAKLKKAIPIKIFFRCETEELLYKTRSHRDKVERGIDEKTFADNWHDYQRNNWHYTMRGIRNANFVVVRTEENTFNVEYVKPVFYHNTLISSDTYHPPSKENIEKYRQHFMDERRTILSKNQKDWMGKAHHVLYQALASNAADVTTRDEGAAHLYAAEATRKYHATDDNFRDDKVAQALLRSEGKESKSQDDLAIIKVKKYGNLTNQLFSHDARFNDKNKLAVENALAALVLDKLPLFSEAIQKVSQKIAVLFSDLVEKNDMGQTDSEEKKVIDFLVEPFKPDSKDHELGRMLTSLKPSPSSAEVARWLVKTLTTVNTDTFFTHMRFHIRFMHLIAEAPFPQNIVTDAITKKIKNLNQALRPDFIFDPTQNRGRIVNDNKKKNLTTSFGTYVDIEDIPQPFRKIIGNNRTLPKHAAGKEFILPTMKTEHNKVAVAKDIPLISSGSGAVPFLICAAYFADLSKEEFQYYHLACIANLVGGGHHSLGECLAVSQRYTNFEDYTVKSLTPQKLAREDTDFEKFVALTNKPAYKKLWVDPDKDAPASKFKHF